MRAVVQRVARASVHVGGEEVGRIGSGMLVLLGILEGDSEADALRFGERIARFRFFPDAAGRMNRSAIEVGGEVLVVSQFTLAADGRSGHRPSFDDAAEPALAERLYERFVDAMRASGLEVRTGRFGARMEVELVNDGPVTFALEERSGTR
jgi:D-tyrosyl-tRNA(Tyr) deacylase